MNPPDGTRLVLVRHGRTQWNHGGRFQGQTDIALDEVGRAQAAAAGPVLAGFAPDLLVTSDLVRAADTAAAVRAAGGPVPRPTSALRESDLGSWEGLTRDEVNERHGAELTAWLSGDDVRRGGGETYREVAVRAQAAVVAAVDEAALALEGRAPLVMAVSHGGAIRALGGAMLGLDHTDWWRLSVLGNCRWATLVRAAEGWRLSGWNTGVDPA